MTFQLIKTLQKGNKSSLEKEFRNIKIDKENTQ